MNINIDAVHQLEILEAKYYEAYGLASRPTGNTWIYLVLDLVKALTDNKKLLKATGPAELEQLTAENYHTMRAAAEIALHLDRLNDY